MTPDNKKKKFPTLDLGSAVFLSGVIQGTYAKSQI